MSVEIKGNISSGNKDISYKTILYVCNMMYVRIARIGAYVITCVG